jgi:hypothetical protein
MGSDYFRIADHPGAISSGSTNWTPMVMSAKTALVQIVCYCVSGHGCRHR